MPSTQTARPSVGRLFELSCCAIPLSAVGDGALWLSPQLLSRTWIWDLVSVPLTGVPPEVAHPSESPPSLDADDATLGDHERRRTNTTTTSQCTAAVATPPRQDSLLEQYSFRWSHSWPWRMDIQYLTLTMLDTFTSIFLAVHWFDAFRQLVHYFSLRKTTKFVAALLLFAALYILALAIAHVTSDNRVAVTFCSCAAHYVVLFRSVPSATLSAAGPGCLAGHSQDCGGHTRGNRSGCSVVFRRFSDFAGGRRAKPGRLAVIMYIAPAPAGPRVAPVPAVIESPACPTKTSRCSRWHYVRSQPASERCSVAGLLCADLDTESLDFTLPSFAASSVQDPAPPS